MAVIDDMISKLSTAFNRSPNSNNYKLLSIIASEYQELSSMLEGVRDAHFIDTATGKNLENIGQLFNCKRLQNETDDSYRARIKVQFRKYASSSTVKEIKEIIAAILNTQTSRIRLRELYSYEPAYFDLWVFKQDIESVGLSGDEFNVILNEIKPIGVKLDGKLFGTFEYRASSEPSDPARGYNDLANSNPNAGTYAGLL